MPLTPAPGPSIALLVEPHVLADMLARMLRAAGADVTIDPERATVDLLVATPARLRHWRGGDVPVVMIAEDPSRPGPTILGTQGTLVHDLDGVLAAVDALATSD